MPQLKHATCCKFEERADRMVFKSSQPRISVSRIPGSARTRVRATPPSFGQCPSIHLLHPTEYLCLREKINGSQYFTSTEPGRPQNHPFQTHNPASSAQENNCPPTTSQDSHTKPPAQSTGGPITREPSRGTRLRRCSTTAPGPISTQRSGEHARLHPKCRLAISPEFHSTGTASVTALGGSALGGF